MLSPGVVLQKRYRIKRLLARGGMGAVYEAEAIHLRNAIVAVKETLYHEDRKNMRDQFEREAATLARLRHPALPQIKDHFIEGNGQFLVMDFIEGDDLGELLVQRMSENGKAFELRHVIEWAERLLDALVYIHSQYPPVIHRDIKPQNLKLTPLGELFLIDFGLAKDATTPTRPGHSVRAYTLEFAPPEQIKGEKTDARSDLYSLGATLYTLVTGKLPPDARLREESVRHLMPDLLQPAHRVNPQVPFAFAVTLSKSMALDRKQRYQTAQEMRDALRPIKGAIEAEIAEKERLEEEARQRKASRRRQRKESTSKKAAEAEIAESERVQEESEEPKPARRRQRKESAPASSKKESAPASSKKAVEAVIVKRARRGVEPHEGQEVETGKRGAGRQRQLKAPSKRSKKAVKAEVVAEVVAKDIESQRPEDEERKKLEAESRRREESARLATVLDEVASTDENPVELKRTWRGRGSTRRIVGQTVALALPIGQPIAQPIGQPRKKKTLRGAIGSIAANLLIALLAYLLWNLVLLAYLLLNFDVAK